jgi:hypothetical protein
MHKRINQALKLFALFIFSFELLTPLFVDGNINLNKSTKETQLVNPTTNPSQLFDLLAEENEERSENNKELSLIFDFDIVSIFTNYIDNKVPSKAYIQHTYGYLAAKPRLFILHSLLLI